MSDHPSVRCAIVLYDRIASIARRARSAKPGPQRTDGVRTKQQRTGFTVHRIGRIHGFDNVVGSNRYVAIRWNVAGMKHISAVETDPRRCIYQRTEACLNGWIGQGSATFAAFPAIHAVSPKQLYFRGTVHGRSPSTNVGETVGLGVSARPNHCQGLRKRRNAG